MPVPKPVPAYPGMSAAIGWERKYLGRLQLAIGFQIHETYLPLRILLCHRSYQAMYACMRRVDRFVGMDSLDLRGDERPAQRPATIAERQQRLDHMKALHDALSLAFDEGISRKRFRSLFGRQPDDVVDISESLQLLGDNGRRGVRQKVQMLRA